MRTEHSIGHSGSDVYRTWRGTDTGHSVGHTGWERFVFPTCTDVCILCVLFERLLRLISIAELSVSLL